MVSNKVIAVCLLILMVGSFAFASNIFTKSETDETNCGWYKRRKYFSDATYTTQVGLRLWFCDGAVGSAGTLTIYFVEDECECSEPLE